MPPPDTPGQRDQIYVPDEETKSAAAETTTNSLPSWKLKFVNSP